MGQNIEISIDSLSFGGGRGVGRYEGLVFFVPDTAPGDTVRARITVLKRSHGEASLLEVLTPSPERREPPCIYAGECGGCSWQHVTYEEQLRQKQAIVDKEFAKVQPDANVTVHAVVPSAKEFHYRNRIQLQVARKRIGYFRKSSHALVEIEQCLLADESLNNELAALKATPPTTKRIEISHDSKGAVSVTEPGSVVREMFFAQVNAEQNVALIERVGDIATQLAAKRKLNHFVDLYCGSGNFTFPITDRIGFEQVTGVELSVSSIAAAKRNAAANMQFIAADVATHLGRLKTLSNTLVLLDPPRAGCNEDTIEQLIRLRPDAIIYVSCHLTTLLRDLKKLATAYAFDEVYSFDMFPQTEYMECVVPLIRRKKR